MLLANDNVSGLTMLHNLLRLKENASKSCQILVTITYQPFFSHNIRTDIIYITEVNKPVK